MIDFVIALTLLALLIIASIIEWDRYRKLKALFKESQEDLNVMYSILEKFEKVDVPLDKQVIEAYMRMFNAAFNEKMNKYNEMI